MDRIKPVLVLLCCALLNSLAINAQDIGKVTIDIDLKDATLTEAFNRIESLTVFRFNYKTSDIANIKGITVRQRQGTVKEILTSLLANTGLQFEQLRHYILIKKIKKSSSGNVTIYGFVTSGQSGETLTGATVSIVGEKTWSAMTNAYGFYSLTVP